MHADELRDPQDLEASILSELAADPAEIRQAFRNRTSERQSSRGSDEAAKLRAERKQLRRELETLRSTAGNAAAALDAYRAENKRLKADLKRLRRSQSYRVGRTLTAPVGLARRAREGVLAALRPAAAARSRTSAAPPTATPDRTAGPTKAVSGHAPRPMRLSDHTYAELVARFRAQPTAEHLGHVLTRAWYGEGLIAEPAALLREHADIAAGFDATQAQLAARIRGADRLRSQGISLPARGYGAAYVPERGRVLYCVYSTPAFNTNGYSVRTRGVAAGLRAQGTDVIVAARAGYPWDTRADVKKPPQARHVVELDGVEYVHLTGHAVSALPTDQYVLQCADAFVREARLRRPAVIQAASNHRVGLAALIAARRLGLPFVYEVRGLWEVTEASDKQGWEDTERYALQRDLETLVATEADAVLAITEETRDELVRRGVDPATVHVAPNAVDPAEFLPLPKDAAYAAAHRVRTDVPVIGFAGSMVPYEGLDVLLDAAALLHAEGADFQLVFAGSGSAEPELRKRSASLGLGERATFVGRVPAADMPRLLSLFDVMPCPRLSLPVTEMVSPLKPLEALSSGKAVVLSDVAPHRPIAGPEQQRARLFPAGDAAALADVLRALITRPDLRADLGRAGRLWCVDERTWTGLADIMRDVHERASVAAAASVGGPRLADLRVGIIADEFTTATLAPSVQLVPLDRSAWRDQLEGLDLVFVESAWNGNGGQWHRGVGHYSPEEHADLAQLLEAARAAGIPSVFWNKEDPVHVERFLRTASLCDHVFTTDADLVVRYLEAGEGTVRSASALPFHAQPRIHNPLAGARPYDPTVAYAGTYYGQRYPQRSRELSLMLDTVRPFGLAIYDRQAAIADSPYHFPPAFRSHVRGSLPYDEVIDSYKAHLANLNVNSVTASPSMFSRRVVEVAACGGVVLSGPGRGIEETFGSAIPASDDPLVWRALLRSWSTDPAARLREAWLQMRTVLRSHTVDTALAIVARTAGIPVHVDGLPTYALVLDAAEDLVASVARQSVLPLALYTDGDPDAVRGLLAGHGVGVPVHPAADLAETSARFVGRLSAPVDRTHFEDLLLADLYGPWDRLVPATDAAPEAGAPIATPDTAGSGEGLVAVRLLAGHDGDLTAALSAHDGRGVRLRRVPPAHDGRVLPSADAAPAPRAAAGTRVLVAGHDLKFATPVLAALEQAGAHVTLDEWRSHTDHDEAESLRLLDGADVVLCEWGLGNAVWYSRHVSPDQRLVVRVHSQELRRPYLAQIEHDAVDAYVFVGELVRQAAIASHGLPADKCHVVPNAVDVQNLWRAKTPEASNTIGLVGIVTAGKRLDLALDVVEQLAEAGHPHRLRIKGKTPQDYPWMLARPDEMAYYDEQYARIDRINEGSPGTVVFDGHGDDMPEWYRGIGVALSVSDFESFHLTVADGAASGALPALLAWPGSDLVHPREWISATVDDLVRRVATEQREPERYAELARKRFAADAVLERLTGIVLGGSADT